LKNFFWQKTRETQNLKNQFFLLYKGVTHMSTTTDKPTVEANRTYLCTIDSVLPGQSKTGTNKVTFSFIVTAGDAKGAVLREDFYLTTKSQWKVKALLDAIGAKKLGDRDPASLMNNFSGKTIVIRTKEEPARTDEETGNEYPARVRASNFLSASSSPAPTSVSEESAEESNVPF
jgi:hypothetical protein